MLFIVFASAAQAACPSTLELQDAFNVKAPAKYVDDGNGNCQPSVVLGSGTQSVGNVTLNAGTTVTIGAALPAGSNTIGAVSFVTGTNQVLGFVSNDPCAQAVKSNTAIAAATATVQLVSGASSKKIYMCSLSLISNALVQVSVIEGTGSLCTTANEAAIIGSTTTTSGMAFTTNGGITLGNGGSTIGFTATAANNICLLQSLTTSLVSGNLTYVQQ